MMRSLAFAAVVFGPSCALASVDLGSLIAFGDEWAFSETAFSVNGAESTVFANNVAGYFTDSGVGNFLIYSNNGVAFGSSFVSALEAGGSTVTRNPAGFSLTAANLAAYDGVFFAGGLGSGSANADAIEAYIRSGGSAYVAAGTGEFGSAAGEAAGWNPLLNRFGLAFGSTWYGLAPAGGTDPLALLDSDSPLRDALSTLEWGFGQSVIDLDAADDANRIDLTGDFTGFNARPPGDRLDIAGTFNVPIPSPGGLAVLAVAGPVLARRRR